MLFDAIFLILFVATWLLISSLSWIALSLRRRARGSLWAAPFAAAGGVGGAVLVPVAGLTNELGVGVSMVAALAGSGLACWLGFRCWDRFGLDRRFAGWSRRRR
ncbi:MAG: hypothetical protein OXH13_02370 [Chloroflexi bacterium]|nr:hypothetical protein [Chloroflexota bacterium]MCY3696866.1 hypothetical protein [Chloroflexota bacterium]MYD15740.1 hypothetical protein [Chloroflexota bacterium]MYJ01862.1 hypothetical protein [Chloroflexota bacterium]